MKKTKNILLSFILFFILIYFTHIQVYASDKEYDIKQATFDIYLTEDGNAKITENWSISFTKGDFTRFYKDIYKNLPKVENFDKIEIDSFLINGVLCEQVNNNYERNKYTYYASSYDNYYTLQWFYPATNETVNYTCTYTLSNVVKETDNDKALFCYRVIGDNFEKKIDKTIVNIYLPKDSTIDVQYAPTSKYETTNNCITFTNNNSKGMQKYHIRTNASIFNHLKYVSLSEIKQQEMKSKMPKFIFIGTILFMVIIITIKLKKREEKTKGI